MIRLSDTELDAVFAAAQPIAIDRRDAFLKAVAHALQGCAEPGPGDIHRAIVAAQRAHCDYPDLSRTLDSSKYSRMAK